MGARRVGDIDALCDIAPPDYAILTSVGFCHYKTFKSVDNIKRAKFELLARTKEFCAVADTDTTRELWQRAACEKELVAVESVGVDSFYVTVDGRREFFRTTLSGRGGQTERALARIRAHRLGVDLDTLRERCLHLEGTPHRLQLVKNGSVTILDDSYNSNLAGVKGMVEVVKSLAGRKLLATCGMVELGKLQYRQNYEFATLCGAFDFVFVISRTNRKAFAAGLAAIDYPPDRVLYFKSLAEFQRFLAEFIRPGDVMVFENDLPDSYI